MIAFHNCNDLSKMKFQSRWFPINPVCREQCNSDRNKSRRDCFTIKSQCIGTNKSARSADPDQSE